MDKSEKARGGNMDGDMIEVKVTEDDIRNGRNKPENSCVIEFAVARALGVDPDSVRWGYTAGTVKGEGSFFVSDNGNKVTEAVVQNDSKSPLFRTTRPFRFSLTKNLALSQEYLNNL